MRQLDPETQPQTPPAGIWVNFVGLAQTHATMIRVGLDPGATYDLDSLLDPWVASPGARMA